MLDSANGMMVTAGEARIPALGCGTWQLRGEICAGIVAEALRLGFRHVDTAQGYANEAAVGDGIRTSGVPREDVFVTTKVQPQRIADGPLQRSVEESLKRLRIDRLDLLLLHWPNPAIPLAESLRALGDARRRGLTRHIGVSNFTIAMLDEAMHLSTEPIVTNQVEYHPYLDQTKVLAANRRHRLATTAYCPIALGRVVGDPVLGAIGKGYGKTAAQAALRWLVQQGDVIAIPRTSRPERLHENLAIFDFQLTAAEMNRISLLRRPGPHLVNEPDWVPVWD